MNDKISIGIDSKDRKLIRIILKNKKKDDIVYGETNCWSSQLILPLIDLILKKNKLDIAFINEIYVELGPGSYTGIRVGTAIGNALGFFLQIPINGKKGIIIPIYPDKIFDLN